MNRKALALNCLAVMVFIYICINVVARSGTSQQGKAEEEPIFSLGDPARIFQRVKEISKCTDKSLAPRVQQRGDYWVLYNYVIAEKTHKCEESVTYTTHADFSFIRNLIPLLERWKGPVSLALHAPGTDFENTFKSIWYLRDCTSPMVKEYVTFHLYFGAEDVPTEIPDVDQAFAYPYNCTIAPPYVSISPDRMYKSQNKLLYPVNVGRNVARETAQTHYILPSDIELYPSSNLILQFLRMIATNKPPLRRKNPKVFPLHLFEVTADSRVPQNKTKLREMLAEGTAIPFHQEVCPECHNVPKAKEWQNAEETKELGVFTVGKRRKEFFHWEPIFIGTNEEPLYDERLSWEGKSDKMTQGYTLCVLDYDFLILDNAFLVHRPGIKKKSKDKNRQVFVNQTKELINEVILPELKTLYGVKRGCEL